MSEDMRRISKEDFSGAVSEEATFKANRNSGLVYDGGCPSEGPESKCVNE